MCTKVCVCVSVAIGLSPLELDFPTLKHLALGVTASRHPSSHSDFPLNVLLLAACSRVSTIPSNHTQSSGHHPFPLAALTCFLLAYLLVAPNLIPGVFALHSWCLLCCSYCFFFPQLVSRFTSLSHGVLLCRYCSSSLSLPFRPPPGQHHTRWGVGRLTILWAISSTIPLLLNFGSFCLLCLQCS